MNFNVRIPDEYYNYIKSQIKELGYMTFNDFILDLLRDEYPARTIRSDVLKGPIEDLTEAPVKAPVPLSTEPIDFSKVSTSQPYDIEEIVPSDNPETKTTSISFLLDKCELFNCGKPSMGRYIVTIYVEGQEVRKEFFMCKVHVAIARRSGTTPIKI